MARSTDALTSTSKMRVLGEVEERLRCVLELAVDFYWEQNAACQFTLCSPREPDSADPLLNDALGKTILELDTGTAGSGIEAYRSSVAARQSFRNVVIEIRGKGATHRFISFSGMPMLDSSGNACGYRGVAQDVSTHMEAERLTQLQLAVSHTLSDSSVIAEGLTSVIRELCESQHWKAGTFWYCGDRSTLLREITSWTAVGCTRQGVLREQQPAPTWLGQEPVWVNALSAHALAAKSDGQVLSGYGTGVLIPVRSGRDLIGVLDFDAPADSPPSRALMNILRTLSSDVAHFHDRISTVERLRESEQRFASTMALAAIGMAHVDDDGKLLYVNPQLCKMLLYTERELTGMNVHDLSHPEDFTATDDVVDQLRRGKIDSFNLEKRYIRKDGAPIWVRLTTATKRDSSGRRLSDISIVEDISVRKSAEERVHYLATHDGLTGLPNRTLFGDLLSQAVETSRQTGQQLAVLFIDLDRFKIINDSLGHEAGDVLLREMASRLSNCLRANDVVARLGGDEFVVLLRAVPSASMVAALARNILSAIMRPVEILGQECRVTASVGICLHPAEGQDEQSIMKNADMAMYLAKESGKNNFMFYSARMQAHAAGRLAMETNLRRALEQQELSLHYQAKVDFKTGVITGVEALLRWNNPALGSVSPTHFIPVAEETGMIVPIGRWVLRTACAQNAEWQRMGLPPVCMSVNLSMRQLQHDGLIDEIKAALFDSGMPPQLLELEITESMFMHNVDRTVSVLTAIKDLGVKLAIDDFGTGYSSLAQLKRFPVATLKLDRSFIREIPTDFEDRAIAEAIIAMGKTLSLTIVAEGVETPEQQAFLCERGCDEMQGFYFNTPLPPEGFAALLKNHLPSPRK
jgi:diguanylate cyclase (GGDEF)-like protein/PAS domain S-box-containing protein